MPPLGASRVSSTAARPAARTRSFRRCFSDSASSLRNNGQALQLCRWSAWRQCGLVASTHRLASGKASASLISWVTKVFTRPSPAATRLVVGMLHSSGRPARLHCPRARAARSPAGSPRGGKEADQYLPTAASSDLCARTKAVSLLLWSVFCEERHPGAHCRSFGHAAIACECSYPAMIWRVRRELVCLSLCVVCVVSVCVWTLALSLVSAAGHLPWTPCLLLDQHGTATQWGKRSCLPSTRLTTNAPRKELVPYALLPQHQDQHQRDSKGCETGDGARAAADVRTERGSLLAEAE